MVTIIIKYVHIIFIINCGRLYVFTEAIKDFKNMDSCHPVSMPEVDALIAPLVYTLPVQLLAYHVAVHKGTDVDQPRNLAKSVTVE